MYSLLKNVHSYWAYFLLLVLILAILNAIAGKIKGKDFESRDL
jgi:VIT1/CCC1 family predicted Fe2+/Mn2+ transporter